VDDPEKKNFRVLLRVADDYTILEVITDDTNSWFDQVGLPFIRVNAVI
jgi:hypothetical protein